MKNNILENVAQAEKILNSFNLDPNDKNYLKIKQQLTSSNQIGYLGLFNDIEKVIYKKGNDFGIDSLNSIEKSIFDVYKQKIK